MSPYRFAIASKTDPTSIIDVVTAWAKSQAEAIKKLNLKSLGDYYELSK